MTTRWQDGTEREERRRISRFKGRTNHIPLRGRIDAVFFAGLVLTGLALAVALFIIFQVTDLLGLRDETLVQDLADERKLTNVRDEIAQKPLLDAEFHPRDNHLYISSKGGVIHRYDPRTRLWSSENPFEEDGGIDSDLIDLRSGNGDDDAAAPGGEILWARSKDGGLARRIEGEWRTVIGDRPLTDRDGNPVAGEDLLCAAISDDGNWLAVGTRGSGMGLYYLPERTWVQPDNDHYLQMKKLMPDGNITHLAWWQDRFWAGGSQGLLSFLPLAEGPRIEEVIAEHAVKDMDADPQGALWVLARKQCGAEGGPNCLWFAALDSPKEVRVLMDERNVFPQLNLADLIFAEQSGGFLTLAGGTGIFVYDTSRRRWSRPYSGQVLDVLRMLDEGSGFAFGYVGGFGFCNLGKVTTWNVAGQRVIKVSGRSRADLLALTDSGRIYGLNKDQLPTRLFSGVPEGGGRASFTHAVAMDNEILLIGPKSALLHDVVTRFYRELDYLKLPSWLRDPATRFSFAGNQIYGLVNRGAKRVLYAAPRPALKANRAKLDDLPLDRGISRSAKMRPWGDYGIFISEPGAVPIQHTSSGSRELVGAAAPDMDGADFVDVTEFDDKLVVINNRGVRFYDLDKRAWGGNTAHPDKDPFLQLEGMPDNLLARTRSGALLRAEPSRSVYRFEEVMGYNPITISDEGLTDVFMDPGTERLFLAGEGKIEAYSTIRRGRIWGRDLGGKGPVTLAGVPKGVPVALNRGIAYVGDRKLEPAAGRVESLSIGENMIWTARNLRGKRYLKGYNLERPLDYLFAQCYFRNPAPAPDVSRVIDARPLPENDVVVSTDAGLFFYSNRARSWFPGPADILPKGGRIFILADEMLLAEERPDGRFRLTFVDFDTIQFPHTCSVDEVRMVTYKESAEHYAVDEPGDRVAMLRADGSVVMRQKAAQWEALAKPGGGPNPAGMRRVFDRRDAENKTLWFTTDSLLYRYDLKRHFWSTITLRFDDRGEKAADIQVFPNEGTDRIWVRTRAGHYYQGDYEPKKSQIDLTRIYTAPTGVLNAGAADIVDFQGTEDSIWTAVLKDRLVFFDPSERIWIDGPKFDSSTPPRYGEMSRANVVTGNEGKTWWVGRSYADSPGEYSYPTDFARFDLTGEAAALDADRTVWQLTADRRILRYRQPDRGNYGKPEVYLDKPVAVSSGQVIAAYEWQGILLFESAAGLTAVDRLKSKPVNLPPEAAGFNGIKDVRTVDDDLLLVGDNRVLFLRKNQPIAARIVNNVERMIMDRGGTPWLLQNGRWLRFNGLRFAAPDQGRPAGLVINAVNGARVTGSDPRGRAYTWSRGWKPVAATLPSELGDNPGALFSGPQDHWWAVKQDIFYHMIADRNGRAMRIVARLPIPPDFGAATDVTGFRSLSREVELTGKTGRTFKVTFDGDISHETSLFQTPNLPIRFQIADTWSQLSGNVVQLADGRRVYDPVTGFSLGDTGDLIAERPSGPIRLAEGGALQPKPGEALTTSWLRWEGNTREFLLRGEASTRRMPLNRVLVDGHFIFEHIDTLMKDAENQDAFHAANQHGIWTYTGRGLFLNDAQISFMPVKLPGRLHTAHGRFFCDLGAISPLDGIMDQTPSMPTIRLGDVELIEDVRNRRVSAVITANNRRVNAFARKGFVWDQERLAVAFDGGNLFLQSSAGLHGSEDYSGFDSGPPGSDLARGKLFNEPGSAGLTFNDGNRWYRRNNGWETDIGNPRLNRTLFSDDAWTWKLVNGQLRVDLVGAESYFTMDKNGFAWDRMRGAAATDTGLSVMTDAFFETRARLVELSRISALRFPAQSTDRLMVRRGGPDGQLVLRQYQGETTVWDHTQQAFVAETNTADEPVLQMNWLRFLPGKNGLRKEMRLMRPDRGDYWASINFNRGRFPFDVVTSILSDDDAIYVGTLTGLQIYRTTLPLRLREIEFNYSMSPEIKTQLTPVDAVVRDPNIENRVVALSVDGALARDPGRPFAWTANTPEASADVRFDTPLWRWVRQPNGTLTGNYKLTGRTQKPPPVEIRAGRFPHDRIRDLVHWRGEAFTLWGAGYITRYKRMMPKLDEALDTWSIPVGRLERFISLANPLVTPAGTAPNGLYAATAADDLFRFDGFFWKNWPEKTNASLKNALLEYDADPPIFAGRDLRLTRRDRRRPLRFEHRVSKGTWHQVPWEGDRVALDRWHDLVQVDGRVWGATAAGFANFARRNDGKLILNPNDLVIIRDLVAKHPGDRVTELRSTAGNGVMVRLNQDSDLVYIGRFIPGNDSGGFQKQTEDLFASRVMVTPGESSLWEWRLEGRRDGKAGYLTVRMGEERPQIVGGRFDFDTLDSIAVFRDGLLEVATEAAGWYQLLREDPRIGNMQRDKIQGLDPLRVRRVGLTLSGDAINLTLQTYADETIRLGPRGVPERTAVFQELLARDGAWNYFLEDGKLQIVGRNTRGGSARRTMSEGRFLDDTVTGRPLAVADENGVNYLVPTKAGILTMNAALQTTAVRVGPFPGLSEDTTPHVLFDPHGDGRIAYASPRAFRYLDGEGGVLAELKLDAPPGSRLTGISPRPGGAWRLDWTEDDKPGWNRLRGEDMGAFPGRTRYIDIRGLEKFQENRIAWGDPTPLLLAGFKENTIVLRLEDFQSELPVNLPQDFQLVAQVVAGNRLLVFGKNHLFEVSLEQAVDELFKSLARPSLTARQ
ncbi:MAG: hypothetical protein QNK37_22075 [Acidobacteriota bacterium]|nr:hypothetical protein [Acidobacteriota bacterium]